MYIYLQQPRICSSWQPGTIMCVHVNLLEGEINQVNNNFLIPSDSKGRFNSQSWNAEHPFLMGSHTIHI